MWPVTGHDPFLALDELVESIRESMVREGRCAADHEMQTVLDALALARAENEDRRRWARERGLLPLNVVEVPDFMVFHRELSVAPEPPRPVTIREESVQQIIEGVASATRAPARPK